MTAEAGRLDRLGWDAAWAAVAARVVDVAGPAAQEWSPARVRTEHRGYLGLGGTHEELLATVSGRLLHRAVDARDLPAVGDWVLHGPPDDEGSVRAEHVLARRSAVVRRAAGRDAEPQVVAANVDRVLIVSSVGRDLNPRRIERYLAVVAASGAVAEVVLTKIDGGDDRADAVAQVRTVAPEVAVHLVSNVTGEGVDALAATLRPGETIALLGTSGVGKSSLVNALSGGTSQDVGAVRPDGRGRHTTVRRELVELSAGAVLLDTPGMRELQLWHADALDAAFAEIVELAGGCRFVDCRHDTEPGCAVSGAVEDGQLSAGRLASYRRLGAELDELDEQREQRRRRRRS